MPYPSATPNIDSLKRSAQQLVALLNDPQPGMFSWNQFLHERIKEIAEFGGYALPAKKD